MNYDNWLDNCFKNLSLIALHIWRKKSFNPKDSGKTKTHLKNNVYIKKQFSKTIELEYKNVL